MIGSNQYDWLGDYSSAHSAIVFLRGRYRQRSYTKKVTLCFRCERNGPATKPKGSGVGCLPESEANAGRQKIIYIV